MNGHLPECYLGGREPLSADRRDLCICLALQDCASRIAAETHTPETCYPEGIPTAIWEEDSFDAGAMAARDAVLQEANNPSVREDEFALLMKAVTAIDRLLTEDSA